MVGSDELAEAPVAVVEQDGVEIDAGLPDDVRRPVGRPAVGVHEDGPATREIFGQPGLDGPDDVADRLGVVEARDADEDVDVLQAAALGPAAAGRYGRSFRHGPDADSVSPL